MWPVVRLFLNYDQLHPGLVIAYRLRSCDLPTRPERLCMVELRMNEYQSEMRVFTEFLKSIYFSREE
jgi:hypothetical protein